MTGAINHLQTAARLGQADRELSCWIQLRLMATIAELAGSQTAMACFAETKRCLTRFGDARPFAALHLWIAEIETTRGGLDSARRHLRMAQSLLAQVDDVWLNGYLAINSFGVSYCSAEISEARRWAEMAIECARLSGHAGARRAAHANLGHIEFSVGRLLKAEECFRLALECSEDGSAHHIAILDSIAQVKLYLGQLQECQAITEQLEQLSTPAQHSKPKHYRAWALQTKIQLLLKQGRVMEANDICKTLQPVLRTIAHPRIQAVLGLLSAEASVANRQFEEAAQQLGLLMVTGGELPPDLLAETERVISKTLSLSGAASVGRIHSERAVNTFEVLGHAIGRAGCISDLSEFQVFSSQSVEALGARTSVDRVRVLLETKRRPELFGLEAFYLLNDLDCATNVTFATDDGAKRTEVLRHAGSKDCLSFHSGGGQQAQDIHLGTSNQRQFKLSFLPKSDAASILATSTFRRIVERILAIQHSNPELAEAESLWAATECLSNQEVVFAAESMMDILKTINKVARTNLNVLITGETGTGKEIIAKAIHERSDRVDKPFIALNCSAVPRDLLESQLFGYRRGAFSGANEQFQGVIRAASGGTLLLDEVGDIPLEMQPKLLRFLESGEIHPLGESRPIKVDVRVLFATNANLDELVRQQRFREDFFFRMNVIQIKIPPLRERREEIPLLVTLFAQRFGRELSKESVKFAEETIERLILYSWPGNVRQLINEVRRLIATVDDGVLITPDLLSIEIIGTKTVPAARPMKDEAPRLVVFLDQTLAQAVDHIERTMLGHALRKAGGRVAIAAHTLGLSRKGLYLKRQRLGMLDRAAPQPA
jgi:transcriptional regulator with GAF, ATPase, and Fis domain/tetratricopeptide (TPR) repeat protein